MYAGSSAKPTLRHLLAFSPRPVLISLDGDPALWLEAVAEQDDADGWTWTITDNLGRWGPGPVGRIPIDLDEDADEIVRVWLRAVDGESFADFDPATVAAGDDLPLWINDVCINCDEPIRTSDPENLLCAACTVDAWRAIARTAAQPKPDGTL
ncbi:MAG: hypothetical protein FJ318_06145 [SAR202 cluster bacterium]|nr:hypothetical protein [SAR202 cluster bacterium]